MRVCVTSRPAEIGRKIASLLLTNADSFVIIYFVSQCDWQNADVAQLVEQLIRNEQVIGSNPTISSSKIKAPEQSGAFLILKITEFEPSF